MKPTSQSLKDKGLSYLRGRGRHWLRLRGLAPPWFWERAVGQRWSRRRRRTERWPGPQCWPDPVDRRGRRSEGSRMDQSRFCVCVCVCDGLNTHMSCVCSGGAVGLLLQLDLLQLLFVHQGQLLLMLLVLFGCESWGRQMVCYRSEQTRAPSFTEDA